MEFEAGIFQKFRVKTKVHLGAHQIDLMEGTLVEFDGQTLKTGSKSYDIPALQGGIKAGWLVPFADTNISQYIPKSAGMKVRPATSAGQERGAEMTIEAASEDEMVVGTLEQANDRRKAQQAASYAPPKTPQVYPTEDPATVEVQYDLRPKTASVEKPRPAPRLPVDDPRPIMEGTKNRPAPKMPVVQDESDDSVVSTQKGPAAWERTGQKVSKDGEVSVARLSSPTHKSLRIGDAGDIAQAQRETEATVPPPSSSKKIARQIMEDPEGEPINANHPSGATGDVNEMRSGDDLAELLPDAATSGTPRPGIVSQDSKGDTRLEWDITRHWHDRVSQAVGLYGNDKNALRQILEVESPAVAKQIRDKLAKLGK